MKNNNVVTLDADRLKFFLHILCTEYAVPADILDALDSVSGPECPPPSPFTQNIVSHIIDTLKP